MDNEISALTANEAACVTRVPLKQVHRIIDTGLLGDAAEIRKGTRVVSKHALIGLKLAHETAGLLTLNSRRRLVRHALHDPEVRVVREHAVSIHVQPIKNDVKRGVTSLERAKKMISSDQEILGGAPCFKGTRIPVHDIAEMLTNEDDFEGVPYFWTGCQGVLQRKKETQKKKASIHNGIQEAGGS